MAQRAERSAGSKAPEATAAGQETRRDHWDKPVLKAALLGRGGQRKGGARVPQTHYLSEKAL